MYDSYRKGKLYLVFEFVDKTLLEILEGRTNGMDVRNTENLRHELSIE